jgi:hypothetical protein
MAVSRKQKKTQARKRPRSARNTRGNARRSEGGRRRRWLVLPLLLGLAGLAVYAFALSGGRNPFEAEAPPLDEIDDVSRLRIENVLREADENPAGLR